MIRDVLCKDVVSVGGVGSVGDDVVNKCGGVVSASCGKGDCLKEAGSEE